MTTEREDEVVERFAFNSCEEAAWADDIGKLQASAEGDYVRYSDCEKTIAALKAKCEKADEAHSLKRHEWEMLCAEQRSRAVAAEAKCAELEKMLFLGDQLADWINAVAPVLQGMMDAYERRIRSLCSPAELENRPWECAEWIVARDMLNKKPIAIVEISALPQPSSTKRDG